MEDEVRRKIWDPGGRWRMMELQRSRRRSKIIYRRRTERKGNGVMRGRQSTGQRKKWEDETDWRLQEKIEERNRTWWMKMRGGGWNRKKGDKGNITGRQRGRTVRRLDNWLEEEVEDERTHRGLDGKKWRNMKELQRKKRRKRREN
jgi:hypothetical protein